MFLILGLFFLPCHYRKSGTHGEPFISAR